MRQRLNQQLADIVKWAKEGARNNPLGALVVTILAVWFLVTLVLTEGADRWGFAPKTFWDWLDLLIVPLVLALGALWFNASQKKTEIAIANDKQRQDILLDYFDEMTVLLLKEYSVGENSEGGDKAEKVKFSELAGAIAKARALAVLRVLDPDRVAAVLRFHVEARLAEAVPLAGGDLSGVDWQGATLHNVELHQINLIDANLSGAYLSGANLSDAKLGRADLSGAYLNGADLSGAYLSRADLSGAYLIEANLVEADLIEAKLIEAKLGVAKLGVANLSGAYLSGAYLGGAYLGGANLRVANLSRANLGGADLGRAYLGGANLSGADLSRADLNGADLSRADLNGADLSMANLSMADLVGANLSGADLSGIKNWTPWQLQRARSLENATMPDGTKYEEWIKKPENQLFQTETDNHDFENEEEE